MKLRPPSLLRFVEEKQLIIDTLRALEYEDAAAEKKATVAEA